MRRAAMALLGALAGAGLGFVAILLFLDLVLPLFGGSDQMSKGIAGTIMVVYLLPVFAALGAVAAFLLSRRSDRRERPREREEGDEVRR